MKHFPPFFPSPSLTNLVKKTERGGAFFFFFSVRQLPGSQNRAAPPHLRDHLYLKDPRSRDAIFEAPKVNVGGGGDIKRTTL